MPQTAHCMPFDTHSNTLVCVLMLVYVLLIDWLGVDEYRINEYFFLHGILLWLYQICMFCLLSFLSFLCFP